MVSIIMATFNRAHLLPETLRSVLNQSYSKWECIIVDDGSTDNTELVVSEFINDDKRMKYVKRSMAHKAGLSGCRNHGLSIAIGDYIQFFDDDDIMHPLMLKIKCEFLNLNQHYDFILCQFESFSGDFDSTLLNSISNKNLERSLVDNLAENYILNRVTINSVGPLWKKSVFDKHRFNEDIHYAEEWALYAILFADGIIGYELTKVLFYYRKHLVSNTGQIHLRNKNKIHEDTKAKNVVFDYLYQKGRIDYDVFLFFIRFAVKNCRPNMLSKFLKQRAVIVGERTVSVVKIWSVFLLYCFSKRGLGMLQ